MDKERFCITADYTIMDVMQKFESNKERGVVIVGAQGKACGFVSMGDIISALANGKSMYSRVEQIYNPSFIYLKEKNYKEALSVFKQRNISLLPIVDENMVLTDVVTARELFAMVELK